MQKLRQIASKAALGLMLLSAALVATIPVHAQGTAVHFNDTATQYTNGYVRPVSTPNVAVCNYVSSETECLIGNPNMATLYTDQAESATSSNPFYGDSEGNYGFWIAPGTYLVTVGGSTAKSYSYVISIGQPNAGSVTSVGLSLPSGLSVTNSPVTSSGVLTVTYSAQNCPSNEYVSGMASTLIPACAQVSFSQLSGTASLTSQVTGILPLANGGTGASSLSAAGIATFTGTITAGDCAKFNNTTGQLADAGAACGSGGGGAQLNVANTWTATQSFQPSSGDAIDILNGSGGNIGKWDSSGNIAVENGLSNLSGTFNITSCSGCNMVLQPGSGGSVTIAGSYGLSTSMVYFLSGGDYGEMVPTSLTANRTYTLPDASGTVYVAGAGTSGCGSGVTEATLGTCVHIFGTTAGETGCKYYLTQAHTLVRLYANVDQVPSGCTTAAVVALWDVTAGSAVASLTIANGASADDSSTLSVSMSANHVYDWSVTTAAAGCSTSPQLYMSATYE